MLWHSCCWMRLKTTFVSKQSSRNAVFVRVVSHTFSVGVCTWVKHKKSIFKFKQCFFFSYIETSVNILQNFPALHSLDKLLPKFQNIFIEFHIVIRFRWQFTDCLSWVNITHARTGRDRYVKLRVFLYKSQSVGYLGKIGLTSVLMIWEPSLLAITFWQE